MNKFLFVTMIFALPAFANALPLVTKTSGGGFVPPEWQRFESCQLFQNKVVVEHDYGVTDTKSVKVVREEKVSITGDIGDLLVASSKEKLDKTPNGLCDAPETTVTAHMVGAPQKDPGFILFASGGCGGDRLERQGPATSALRDLIDQYCPLTYDNH